MFVHPTGSYGYQSYGHDASMSGSGWDSDHEGGYNRHDFLSQHNEWVDMYLTPAPPPTQETRYDQEWSELPPRNVRAPHMYMWTPTPTPPPRRGRQRGWCLSSTISIYVCEGHILPMYATDIYLSMCVRDIFYLCMRETYFYPFALLIKLHFRRDC